MPCNCGKSKRDPAAPPVTPSSTARPTSVPVTKKLGTGKTQSFSLLLPSGSTESFGSMLEAQAARVRRGGTISSV